MQETERDIICALYDITKEEAYLEMIEKYDFDQLTETQKYEEYESKMNNE